MFTAVLTQPDTGREKLGQKVSTDINNDSLHEKVKVRSGPRKRKPQTKP